MSPNLTIIQIHPDLYEGASLGILHKLLYATSKVEIRIHPRTQ